MKSSVKEDFATKPLDTRPQKQRDSLTDVISLRINCVITLCISLCDQDGGERSVPGVTSSNHMLEQLHTSL